MHNDSESYADFGDSDHKNTQPDDTETQENIENTRSVSRDSGKKKTRSTSRDSTSTKKKKAEPKKTSGSRSTTKETTKKTKKTTQKAEEDVHLENVRNYVVSVNRPFAISDVVLKFKNEVGKTQLQRILNQLVEEKSIYTKGYGKTPIYCAVQDQVEIPPTLLEELDKAIETGKGEVSRLRGENEKAARTLTTLGEYPRDEVLRTEIENIKSEIKTKKGRLQGTGDSKITETEMKSVESEIKKTEKEMKKRRTTLKTIIDSLCEGTGMTKKDLSTEIGIE